MGHADTREELIETIEACIEKVTKEKVTISLAIEPDGRTSVDISPWEPFHYICPNAYRCEPENEKSKSQHL